MTTTPSGSSSYADVSTTRPAYRESACPLPACTRIEADGGSGGEVETLGGAVERDADTDIGGRGDVIGQPVRLVAEDPRDRSGQAPAHLFGVQVVRTGR